MSRWWSALLALALLASPVAAQTGDAMVQDSGDVATLDGIMAALYDVISGPPGDRDWERFQSLFLPGAILMNAGPRPDTVPPPRPVSPAGYQENAAPFFRENGFFESEVARVTHRYGTVAQIWSTYESRSARDEPPFSRGINSIVAVRHAGRWWITGIVWDFERPDNPIPEAYLPGGSEPDGG